MQGVVLLTITTVVHWIGSNFVSQDAAIDVNPFRIVALHRLPCMAQQLLFISTGNYAKTLLKPAEKGSKMNTTNLVLAACTALAFGTMATEDAAAQQCRLGGRTTSYNNGGFNNGGNGYNTGYPGYGNSYNIGSRYNNRSQIGHGYDSRYRASSGYNGYSNNRSSLSIGQGYNSGYRNSGYRSTNVRSGYGTGYYGNTAQQPVAYRHGDHIDVQDGNLRHHITGRGGF